MNAATATMDRAFAGRIGVARRDITPPAGIYARNWGAARHDVAEGIHRPMTTTALAVFGDNDAAPLILIAVDLGWFKSPSDEWIIRRPVLEGLSLDAARLMICLSHTHAGPSVCLDDADQPGGHLVEPYVHSLGTVLLDAAREAMETAQPALLTWRCGLCDLAVNRDLPDPDDAQRRLVGYNPVKSADTTVLVGRVTRHDGRMLATIVNYACHPTTLAWDNKLISPDYVGAMRQTVESATGGAPCVFLQGASGDLAPAEQYVGDVSVADRHGAKLGHAVLATLHGMSPPGMTLRFDRAVESGARLGVWKNQPAEIDGSVAAMEISVSLPLKPQPSVAEVQHQIDQCHDHVLRERLRRRLRLVRFLGGGPRRDMPLWVWRIGNARLFGQPNEAYSSWQMTLRQHWPDRPVAAMNLVNGSCGYLVPSQHCHGDLYSFWQSPFDPQAFSTLLEASLTGGEQLKATKIQSAFRSNYSM